MSKPRLGKGLGHLMNGDGVAGRESTRQTPQTGRGFNTLIKDPRPPAQAESAPETPAKPFLPDWFFYSADLLLLGFTVAIVYDAPNPLTAGDVVFCAVAVGLAMILGLMPIVRQSSGG